MRKLRHLAVMWAAVTIVIGLMVTGASGATPSTPTAPNGTTQQLRAPAPFWLTAAIQRRITAAGTEGASLEQIQYWVDQGLAGEARQDETVQEPCPTADAYRTVGPTVKAGACQVAPFGCTANFIYYRGPEDVMPPVSDGRNHFIGTAGHCVQHANQPVFMQVERQGAVVAKVGEVEKILAGDIGQNGRGNGGIGNDFAIIEIDPGFQVDPEMPAPILGPQGIYTGCETTPVKWYGHGLGVAVGQGRPEVGLATNWYDRSYGWSTVTPLPGDSGSGVLTDDGAAAGNLTHLLVDFERYPGSNLAGTRLTRALTWMGRNYSLVNADYTTVRATMSDTDCGNANSGGATLG
jgi:hypothetical protein